MEWKQIGSKISKSSALPDFNATFVDPNGIAEWLVGFPQNLTGGPTINSFFGGIQIQASAPSTSRPTFAAPTYSDQAVLSANMTSQYVKTTLTTVIDVGASLRGGPAVALSGINHANSFQGYYIELETEVPTANLQSIVDNGVALQSNIFMPAQGDVLEMEVSFGVGQNVIQIWQNAVQVLNFADNEAGRPIPGGDPGFFYNGAAVGTVVSVHVYKQFLTRPTR